MSEVDPGTVIDGRYRVLSRIGSGGMADVYLAEDELLSRQVAVKVLQRRFVEDQEFVERFRREASSAAGLSHPNVVAIFDRGSWDGTYYIAMEYLEGRSLKRLVREHGALDPRAAIDITIQVLLAASFAHSRGIVHRDIKPHNVILSDEGRVTVTDFGIARAGASDMTHTGSIMGTAQYLSPEQAQGHPVSAASDIYAIGVLLFELLTGRVPFEGESAVAIALQHISSEPPAPSAVNPALPAAVDAVVLRALAKDPAERYRDAREFIDALEDARSSLGAAGEPGEHAAGPRTRGHYAPALAAGAAAGAGAALASTTPLGAAAAYANSAPRQSASAPAAVALVPPADTRHVVGLAAGPPGRTGGPPSSDGDDPQRRRRRRMYAIAAGVAIAAAALAAALTLISSPGEVTVPALIGQSETVAVHKLKALGLSPSVRQASSVIEPAGVVLAQSPSVGTVARKGTRVYVTVSTGPANVAVPGVTGKSQARAVRQLHDRGLNPVIQDQPSRKVEAGVVISTSPSAGTVVLQGSQVTVLVSSGPAGGTNPTVVHVPDVVGSTLQAATEELAVLGLTLGTVTRRGSSAQPETVISQLPVGGASLTPGGAVNLVIAEPQQAAREVVVPNVVGKSETAAAAALGAAGLNPTSSSRGVASPAENGIVIEESPEAGQKLKRGTTVMIVVGVLEQVATTTTVTATPAAPHP
jgi:serine/threonine-protein kinase